MATETGSRNLGITDSDSVFLGRTIPDQNDVRLPLQVFKRHFMALGGSGSGKTVLCKCVAEEAVRKGIPVLIIDPQGDISSLAIRGDTEELIRHGTTPELQEDFFSKARVAIFTPASSRAIPICVNPFKSPSQSIPYEEAIQAIDLTADSLTGLLGYDLDGDAGKATRAYVFTILEYMWQRGETIDDVTQLADMVLHPPGQIATALSRLVSKREPDEISKRLRYLTVGTSALMFEMGVQIDVNLFLDCSDGKVPVNIIYLNTLTSENDKQFFLATLLKELYCWMLKNPSNELRMLFYVDEISPYIPPYPRNPPPKNAYALLFKQARKYGIGLVAATQNVTDIDYKALAQVNTWCLGRMMTTQDIARVQRIIQSLDPSHSDVILKKLPGLKTGEFLLLSPDLYKDVVDFNVRWLVSKHLILDEKDLAQNLPAESRVFFGRYMSANATKKWATAAHFEPTMTSDEKIQQFLRSERKAISLSTISEKLGISQEETNKVLAVLAKSGAVKKDRTDGETLYWLSEYKFDPSRGFVSESLVISPVLTQADAIKRLNPLLEGGMFHKDEEVHEAELRYLPIWRIEAVKTTHSIFSKKEEKRVYYMSAETGDLISLENKEIVYHRLVTNSSQKMRNLDEDKRFVFELKMPREVDKLSTVKLSEEAAGQNLRLKIGVTPESAKLILLPVWSMRVEDKKGKSKRSLRIDAATGRLINERN